MTGGGYRGVPAVVCLSDLDLPDFAGVPVVAAELLPVQTVEMPQGPEQRWVDPMGRLWGRRIIDDDRYGMWREVTP